MKKRLRVNEELVIEVNEKRRSILFFLLEGEKREILFSEETGNVILYEVAYNLDFVIVYSKIENRFLAIEAAYSVKTKKRLSLANINFKRTLEYMLIHKRAFDMYDILCVINMNFNETKQSDIVIRYLTAGYYSVKREAVVEYILKQYPALSKYTTMPVACLKQEGTREQSIIIEELGTQKLSFHVMQLSVEMLGCAIDVSKYGELCLS